jgi:electron transport complex protein RnfD
MSDVSTVKKPNLMLLQSSPHIAARVDSSMLMRNMYIALAPVSIYGIVIFGLPALLNIIVAVVSAVAGESIFRILIKQPVRAKDFSAGITGLLLALIIPPTTPLWMTALGALFGVIIAKEFFGGMGANVFNPALVGRAFLLMSFPVAMTSWRLPGQGFVSDAVTGATPLGISTGHDVALVSRAFLENGFAASDSYWSTMRTLFFGFHGGSTGETSAFLILTAFLFLLSTKTIDWRVPVIMTSTAAVTALLIGLDPLYSVLSGGLLFGAIFMATDYVTGPITGKGRIIFGIGAGILSILIRAYGTYPEGVSYGILIMNCTVPFLNKILSRKYGYVPKKKPAANPGPQPSRASGEGSPLDGKGAAK